MTSSKMDARITGVLFILATVSAVLGVLLYAPLLNDPDFLRSGQSHTHRVILGALFELILASAAVGTAITLFPYVKRQNESLALGYVSFRVLEATLIIVGVLSMLSYLTLRNQFMAAPAPHLPSFQTVGGLLLALHEWTFLLGPNFMLGINTLMCAFLLHQSRLVPRGIATLGLVGGALILTAAVLELFGVVRQLSPWGVALALPVAAYEMILAGWLITKGFRPTAIHHLESGPQASGSAAAQPMQTLYGTGK
ncbi:DUF4386 domain-containing protein [Deinococcus deserti]|uniref:DUF4386 domain-containing protein n=1 Tax=Deinococcus deserti (strain DSM 17065 / CIP 109153 / LMG 22923 / VCD115) TaxID=546414 RepID=C1D3W7_DEIDV|nr:DUF4386 domain-containing protein [Deinococcus deserti]ACO48196.2 conserved hypothetical protein; putative membrane protein [Deinococcus deserti VCD115]